MRSLFSSFAALTLLTFAGSAHAVTCKPDQGIETKVEFKLDEKGNPVMPDDYRWDKGLRPVHQVCIKGITSVTFTEVPTASTKNENDMRKAVVKLMELKELGITPEGLKDLSIHVWAEMAKVTPKEATSATSAMQSIPAPSGAPVFYKELFGAGEAPKKK